MLLIIACVVDLHGDALPGFGVNQAGHAEHDINVPYLPATPNVLCWGVRTGKPQASAQHAVHQFGGLAGLPSQRSTAVCAKLFGHAMMVWCGSSCDSCLGIHCVWERFNIAISEGRLCCVLHHVSIP